MLRFAVTGSNGYVGSRICDYIVQKGNQVLRLERAKGRDDAGPERAHYSLDENLSPEVLSSARIDTLVHCAYDFRELGWRRVRRINVEGSLQLLEAARRAGVKRFVFVSSLSAYPGCRSMYGRAKLEIENEVLKAGGVVVRPGLIYGDTSGGMMGTLRRAVEKLPLVPALRTGSRLLYPVHEEDLCAALVLLGDPAVGSPKKPVVLAPGQGVSLTKIFGDLAHQSGRRVLLLPTPWRPLWLAIRALELVWGSLPVRSDSLLSLVTQPEAPDFSTARGLGLVFREWGASGARAQRGQLLSASGS